MGRETPHLNLPLLIGPAKNILRLSTIRPHHFNVNFWNVMLYVEQPCVLLLNALIHDKQDTMRFSQFLRLVIDDAELKPDSLGFKLDRLLNNGQDLFRPSEYIDDIHLARYFSKRRIGLLPEYLRVAGIDGDNTKTVRYQIVCHDIAGLLPVG